MFSSATISMDQILMNWGCRLRLRLSARLRLGPTVHNNLCTA